ncbi:hypothetical protein ACFE04_009326 [Oxalis oulophora]
MIEHMSSFDSYGRLHLADQVKLESRRRTRKRTIIISLCAIILTAVIVGAVLGTRRKSDNKDESKNSATSTSIQAVCDITLYKDSCYKSLGSYSNSSVNQLLTVAIKVAVVELTKVSNSFSKDGFFSGVTDNATLAAIEDCRGVLDLALDYLNDTLSTEGASAYDRRTWLSTAETYQQTCIDSFEETNSTLTDSVKNYLNNSTQLISNSLAIVTWISKISDSIKSSRRLLSEEDWYRSASHRLLIETDPKSLRKNANIVVAKDGSSKYKTISSALNAVKDKSTKRFVIYVKKGVYYENVIVEKNKWNVLMIGDGMDKTIVSGSLNYVDGTPTFSSATFAALAKGFIAREMGFRNSAGPNKHQAVALLSTSDFSIFYNCAIDAYQDTLYVHSNRQFYRQCNIYGTVDFIFGNAAAVLQNCNIFPRKPSSGQKNVITAQGKVDPNQNTGISIQNCSISPFGNLAGVKTYLGRPWKDYSTTIFMQSLFAKDLIDPSGWLPWTGNSAPNTIYYAEYQNYGTGYSTKNRVKWKGVKTNSITYKDVSKFSVKTFLGEQWVYDSGVPYKSTV